MNQQIEIVWCHLCRQKHKCMVFYLPSLFPYYTNHRHLCRYSELFTQCCNYYFCFVTGTHITWPWVSHVLVHEGITWDLTVLWQDVFTHVSYPLSFGYAHAALSGSVSLLWAFWEQIAKCTVCEREKGHQNTMKGAYLVIWWKWETSALRLRILVGKIFQNSECCCLTTDNHTSK